MSFVSLCLTSLAGLTTRCHKMAKRIIPTWRDNVLWRYLVGGKNVPTPFQQHAAQLSLFLGVLCGGVCVSLTLRLYDNSAGCLLAMKEEHMENDPWNGLLPLMFCSDHFWEIWEIYGHMWTYCQRFKSTLHFSQSFATPLGRFAALKTAQSLINAGGAGESTCLFAEFERDVSIFHGAWDITTKWVGYGLTWFYMGSNSESMGVYLVKPTNTFFPFSYVISWKFSTEDDPHWTFSCGFRSQSLREKNSGLHESDQVPVQHVLNLLGKGLAISALSGLALYLWQGNAGNQWRGLRFQYHQASWDTEKMRLCWQDFIFHLFWSCYGRIYQSSMKMAFRNDGISWGNNGMHEFC